MTPNPILKVLSSMKKNGVRCLLMGGQACVIYGAAEFSRDTDLVVLAEPLPVVTDFRSSRSASGWPAQNWGDVWLGVGCTNLSFFGPKSVAKKYLIAAKKEISTPHPKPHVPPNFRGPA
ncbi:MAG: hypothetical protein NTY19_09620, partial [Planctomycetota bacterium]|nr:hypothetical protein [Planctomycetota bacterium]